MSSIVQDLQRNALDPSVKVSDLLRLALVIARKLKLKEFDEWITRELDGYSIGDIVPVYRISQGLIEAFNPYHGWHSVLFADPAYGEALSACKCSQRMAELEDLASGAQPGSMMMMPFDKTTELELSKGMGIHTSIRRRVSPASIKGIIDGVRTAILRWALKLEEDGILGEDIEFSPLEKDIAAQNTYIVENYFANSGSVTLSHFDSDGDIRVGGDVTGRDQQQ